MTFKAGLVVGAAVGYYFGAKAGRERYHQIERYLQPLRESQQWSDVQNLARGFVDEMLAATKQAVKDATAPDQPDPVRRIA
jgi:hypothetical protein